MIDKQQSAMDIQRMNYQQRYNHVLSCLGTVLEGNKESESHKDATILIRLHASIARQTTMESAQMSTY